MTGPSSSNTSGASTPGTAAPVVTPYAEMMVSRIIMRSFRCLEVVELFLNPQTTILVGENNAGKSSILLAIATALGRRRPVGDDLRRRKNGLTAKSATIDIFVSPPPQKDVFTDTMRQRLLAVQREVGTGRETLAFRTTIRPSGEGSWLSSERRFLQPSLDGSSWVESAILFQPRVLDLFDAHVLDAARDLVAETNTLTSSWGRVLSDLQIPDLPDRSDATLDPLGRRGLEEDIKLVSARVRSASPVLSQLQRDLKLITSAQATVSNVELTPLPLRLDELARTMEVVLFQRESADLPLRFHGLGSRSLAALLVFRTMCELRVGADQGLRPWLLTLLEEPEAHLHPQAVAALPAVINGVPGQRVIATHSATLVAEVPPNSLRLLRRTDQGVVVTSVADMTQREMEKFRRFFGRPFGEIFFARLVVLGDGATERNALPTLVEMGLGTSPAGQGIAFVDCESMSNHPVLNHVLLALHKLGIQWICFSDNDDAGKAALGKLKDPESGRPLTQSHPAVVMVTGTKRIEQLLIDADYREEIATLATENGAASSNDDDLLDFLRRSKPWAAEAVALRAKAAGRTCPTQLDPLIGAIKLQLKSKSAIAATEGAN